MRHAAHLAFVVLLLTALVGTVGCDKDATRDDQQPTGQSNNAETTGGDAATNEAPKEDPEKAQKAAEASFDHTVWDGLLKKYVTEKGLVRYKAWKEDAEAMKQLDAYLEAIAKQDVAKLSGDSALAFWINGYNALAIKGILNAYPVASVEKIPGLENFQFFKGPKHKIAQQELTLDEIENKKIREGFKEPRIHFVLNCTALSCPIIRRDALTKGNMDAIMDQAAKEYVNQEVKIDKKTKKVTTSEIFNWFGDDFKRDGKTVNDFLAGYLDDSASAELVRTAKLEFHTYNWALNEAKE